MYKWYRKASICVAYLFDVHDTSPNSLVQSEWFKRGWTLQELLAPAQVVFYSANHQLIGTKSGMSKYIMAVTGIGDIDLVVFSLYGANSGASAAKKMSWAAGRKTTREEDLAYCLLGLFGINMPLLYGEGNAAFLRLQEEIIKQHDDESIFAWTANRVDYPGEHGNVMRATDMLARSPDDFINSRCIQKFGLGQDLHFTRRSPYAMTNKGLETKVPLPIERLQVPGDTRWYYLMQLNCNFRPSQESSATKSVYVLLIHHQCEVWVRIMLPFHIVSERSDLVPSESSKQPLFESIRLYKQPPPMYERGMLGLIESTYAAFIELDPDFSTALRRLGILQLFDNPSDNPSVRRTESKEKQRNAATENGKLKQGWHRLSKLCASSELRQRTGQ